jgi:dihydroneopterin aldolase
MTYMLASVIDAAEVRIALDAGADIINLRDAGGGALPAAVVREAVVLVSRRRTVSATVGNLMMEPALLVERVAEMAETGVDYVCVRLCVDPGLHACIEALRDVSGRVALVGAMLADQRPDLGMIRHVARAGFAGVMLDTLHKAEGGLLRYVTEAGIGNFLGRAATMGLFSGLGGSFALSDIPLLLELGPDFIGFRGTLCAGGRLDPALAAAARMAIPRHGEVLSEHREPAERAAAVPGPSLPSART